VESYSDKAKHSKTRQFVAREIFQHYFCSFNNNVPQNEKQAHNSTECLTNLISKANTYSHCGKIIYQYDGKNVIDQAES